MTHMLVAGLAALLIFSSAAVAGTMRTITLNDGSSLTGEVVSFANGVYEIRSAALGVVRVKDSDVLAIGDAPVSAPVTAAASGGQLEALQQHLLADDKAMDKIRRLKDDPAFRKVLNDPEILRALKAGDTSALLANPNIARLAEHPTIKELGKSFGQ